MPIISRNPITNNDKVFDRLSVQVAISPVMKSDDVGSSFAIQFKHYTKNSSGIIEYPETEAPVGFAYSSALATTDTDIENCVQEIMSAIAKLAEIKGI